MIISNKYVTIEFHNPPKSISKFLEQLESKLEKFRTYFDLKEIFAEVSFLSPREIKDVNKQFRDKDNPTNVLAFPSEQPTKVINKCHGEVLICAEILIQESLEQGKKLEHHFLHLLFHALLHLVGYMHDKEEDAIFMENKETNFLKSIGIDNPYK